jgi:hypothetical protein
MSLIKNRAAFVLFGLPILLTGILIVLAFGQDATASDAVSEKTPSVWSGNSIVLKNRDDKDILTKGYDKPYSAKTRLTCGSLDILVQTNCDKIVSGQRPTCHSQKVFFGKNGNVFKIHTSEKEETIGYYIDCLKMENQVSWIVLQSGNFGSGRDCTDCERSDYFNSKGTYLGSDESPIGLRSVRGYKVVAHEIKEKISELSQWGGVNARTQINTYPTAKESFK